MFFASVSILHAGNVIRVGDIVQEESAYTQIEFPLEDDKHEKDYRETGMVCSSQTDEL